MESRNSEGPSSAKKRKFTPNITKALAKKSQASTPKFNDDKQKPREPSRKPNSHRGRINRKALDSDDNPRFVQSYSIFEDGIGCVEKNEHRLYERNSSSSKSSKTAGKTVTEPENPTEPMNLDDDYSTNSSVPQVFKYPPNTMPPDPPEVSSQFKRSHLAAGSSSADNQSASKTSASVVHELFDESQQNGRLFALRIPDALLYEGSPLEKSGKFGKIQILDNGETRLVIGDCFFRLTSPGWAPYSTDVVLVEDEEEGANGNEGGGGVVNLTSLGHIDQFVTAVPDLDQFTRLGR